MGRIAQVMSERAAVGSTMRSETGEGITAADVARVIYSARAGIGQFFEPNLFADPAFDMLLFMFLEDDAGRAVETSSCYRASGVPRTTAIRWINMMVANGMFISAPHPTDRRLTLLRLSDDAREGVRRWLNGMRPMIARMTSGDQPTPEA